MSFSDTQETLIVEHAFGISATPPTVGTHLAMCTADPEAGTGVSTATRIARGTFATNATQQSGRRRVANTGSRVFTNDSGSSITVTHIALMSALTGGAVIASMALSTSSVVPAGATLTFADGELTFDVG